MTETLADPLVARYRALVQEMLAERPVEAPRDMVATFTRMIQTASPATLTGAHVAQLVQMGRGHLAGERARVAAGELSAADYAGLCGQFRAGALLLTQRAAWLDEAARAALADFVRDVSDSLPAAPAAPAPAAPATADAPGQAGSVATAARGSATLDALGQAGSGAMEPPAPGTPGGADGNGVVAPAGPLAADAASVPPRRAPAERYAKSQAMLRRARERIPMASQTHRKSYHEVPAAAAPLFLERGLGAVVWDVDGNAYLDFVGCLMAISLGYRDPDVDAAIRAQLERGLNLSLPTGLELELADELVDLIPCAEMVRFGKNGSDATSAAVRLARAATGRDHVAVCGYHGYPDWYIGSTTQSRGVPAAVRALTHHFVYNDLQSLADLLDRHPGQFAAAIMEPMHTDPPAPGFLAGCRDLIHARGGLLIFDETITGFKFHLGGAQTLFGVVPDLATFSKGMANGMPLSALVGPRDLMHRFDAEVYYSVTFGGETLSLAAALATVRKMRREPVVETLWSRGAQLASGLRRLLAKHRVTDLVQLRGAPCWSHLVFLDADGVTGPEVRALLQQELFARGVLVTRAHTITYALTEAQVDQALAAYDAALAEVAAARAARDLPSRLADPHVDPGIDLRRAPAPTA